MKGAQLFFSKIDYRGAAMSGDLALGGVSKTRSRTSSVEGLVMYCLIAMRGSSRNRTTHGGPIMKMEPTWKMVRSCVLKGLCRELRGFLWLGLLVCLCSLFTGCVPLGAAKPDRLHRAEQLVDKGVVALRARDLERAQAAFLMATEVAPTASAYDGLGCVALLRGDFVSSAESFRQALRIDPRYHRAIANWALLEDLQGHQEIALTLYNYYLNQYPDAAYIRNNKATLEYERGGRRMWVAQELQKALLVTPHAVIQGNLDRLREESNGRRSRQAIQ